MLHMEHLTKDYGNGQGVFDICLDCEKGTDHRFGGKQRKR